MTFEEYLLSTSKEEPSNNIPVLLKALWYDYKGDWKSAHDIVENLNDTMSSWIHAYLHRKEGDLGNASYWYGRANQKMPQLSLNAEWEQLSRMLLK